MIHLEHLLQIFYNQYNERMLGSQLDGIENVFRNPTNNASNSLANIQPHRSEHHLLPNTVSNLEYVPQSFGDFANSRFKQTHKHHYPSTKTKWQTYTPYSFSKLTTDKKVQTFLQLFEDYQAVKTKNNQQNQKNRKLLHDITVLEQELRRAKEKSKLSPADRIIAKKERDQQNQQLKTQVRRLHEKIIALSSNNKNIRPKSSNAYGKGFHQTQKIIVPTNQNLRSELEIERKQVRQLLLIIEELKKNKFVVEQQLKNKQMGESVVSRPKKIGNKVNIQNQSEFQGYANDLQRWKEKYEDLELCYNRMNQDKDKKINELSAQLIDLQENQRMKRRTDKTGGLDPTKVHSLQQQNRDLVEEKEKLQSEIRRLVLMPFYQNNKEAIDLQQKIANLDSKCRKLAEELSQSKETSVKYFSELQYKTRQNDLLKSQNTKVKAQFRQIMDKEHKKNRHEGPSVDYNDFYRKLLNLVRLEGDDPVWKKFSNIAEPMFSTMNNQQMKTTAQKLWTDKLELLAHLQRAKIELSTIKQHNDGRINTLIRDRQNLEEELRITKARLDEWMSMERVNVRRDFQVFEQGGIHYDDSVSVFEAEEDQLKVLQANENYFDLFLGQIVIDQNSLIKNSQNKVKNSSQVVSFITVDFYNHETQHSDFVEGLSKKLGNNYSFKVEVNPYFVKYMSKNSVAVQLWSPQGTATVLLGRGEIWLRDLIGKASKDISPVVRGKCPIYFQDRTLMATVQYRIRMRMSISPFLQWAQTKADLDVADHFSMGRKKTLSITIERGLNFKPNVNAFVYFTLQNEDYFSEPQHGPSPLWDFHRQIQLVMNEELMTELKQKYLQFTIFDDDKQVSEDIYGIAKANLTPLIDSTDTLDLKLDVRSDVGQEIGKLIVKVSWL